MQVLLGRLRAHIQNHIGVYFFVIVLFVVGIVCGAVAVKALGFGQRQELMSFLQQFSPGEIWMPENSAAFLQTLLANLRSVGLIWLMALVLFGLPLIVCAVFFRGFVIGFSVGFLANELGWRGVLFSVCSIIPHNLFSVPALLGIASLSILHVLQTLQFRRAGVRKSYWENAASLTVRTLLLALLTIFSSLVETFVTPLLVRLLGLIY
ncbi:MAG: stage II sporulation protein M [Bacillota bacterium]|jgi:stage II sporulation protein M